MKSVVPAESEACGRGLVYLDNRHLVLMPCLSLRLSAQRSVPLSIFERDQPKSLNFRMAQRVLSTLFDLFPIHCKVVLSDGFSRNSKLLEDHQTVRHATIHYLLSCPERDPNWLEPRLLFHVCPKSSTWGGSAVSPWSWSQLCSLRSHEGTMCAILGSSLRARSKFNAFRTQVKRLDPTRKRIQISSTSPALIVYPPFFSLSACSFSLSGSKSKCDASILSRPYVSKNHDCTKIVRQSSNVHCGVISSASKQPDNSIALYIVRWHRPYFTH
ncbi:hypothetical protein BDP27DRAFT_993611 [Rhodocollybia butyracea]|uniref:Uncharacterized protein n=1 Tax=Rhodocollybia butyracea TaxID=206335 RepID=A0A9P5U6D3_9AGAR|nr:hypothetical protein BDP27DRAFT_993611 [Rhodocollybia butyracea]